MMISDMLLELADLLELKGENRFRINAYRKAATAIENYDLKDMYEKSGIDGLLGINGVGRGIAEKIEEALKTGKIRELEELREELSYAELMAVPGIGPRTARELNAHLGVKSIEELERAARERRVRRIPGMGEKTEKNILRGIELWKSSRERKTLAYATAIGEGVIAKLGGEGLTIAGSLRRGRETIGDIDILAISDAPDEIIKKFVLLAESVLMQGTTRASIIMNDMQVDLRVVNEESFGSALLYFTGSKEHNIRLREIAQRKGLKINEYGVFSGEKRVGGREEREIYAALGLQYIPPEIREDLGEIELSQKNGIPELADHVSGDLHVHSLWSDGRMTISSIAQRAEALGYEWVAVCDHSKSLKVANGLDEKRFAERNREIDSTESRIKILKGAEVEILDNGDLDLSAKALEDLDVVLAAVHTKLNMSEREMTNRVIRALNSGRVDIFAHPTGIMRGQREGYRIDLERIAECDVAFEINCSPDRMDLNGSNIRKIKQINEKAVFSIGTDAHAEEQMDDMRFGIKTARRGMLEDRDLVGESWIKTR